MVGVFGRISFVGDPGTEASPDLGFAVRRERDSVERAALNFFAELRRLGVVARGILPAVGWSSDEIETEWGRLGVKGTGRTSLLDEFELEAAMISLASGSRS